MAEHNTTKQALADALKHLMTKQPLEKITVGDVCRACGMSRKGFYYHFRDKYDLVNWIFYSEYVVPFFERSDDSVWAFYESICAYFYENRLFYANAFAVEGQNSFSEYFAQTIRPLARERFRAVFGEGAENDFYASFFTDAFRVSLVRWLGEQNDIPPEEYVVRIKRAVLAIAGSYASDNRG